ncbi:Prefoldin [Venustampulla echinocandica]|uniref:Prefoldin n=1 Tax=Venustampulla echinocandica TaxID=2656787 RepID=A0A370TCA2_9HELO|nr:Prefoldin [Venustampulla echinocandica]RDL31874.1 Prefoldin [Venustampulla echinocandica]
MADTQQRLQALSTQYDAVQQELQSYVSSRQKLESQQHENKAVQKEFSGLKDDANIYKLVGPVLLKQDRTEAVLAVDGRLEYIDNEIQRVEKQIKEAEDKTDALRAQIIQVQADAAPQGQGPQAQVAA